MVHNNRETLKISAMEAKLERAYDVMAELRSELEDTKKKLKEYEEKEKNDYPHKDLYECLMKTYNDARHKERHFEDCKYFWVVGGNVMNDLRELSGFQACDIKCDCNLTIEYIFDLPIVIDYDNRGAIYLAKMMV